MKGDERKREGEEKREEVMGRKAEGKVGRRWGKEGGRNREGRRKRGKREKRGRKKSRERKQRKNTDTFMLSSCPSSIYSLQNCHDFQAMKLSQESLNYQSVLSILVATHKCIAQNCLTTGSLKVTTSF